MKPRHVITLNGETLTRQQWSDRLGIPLPTIAWRHNEGMSPEMILTQGQLQGKTNFKISPRRNRSSSTAKRVQKIAKERDLTFDDYERLKDDYEAGTLSPDTSSADMDNVVSVCLAEPTVVVPPKQKREHIHTRRTLLTFDGETKTVDQWAHLRGMRIADLLTRLKAGESVEACLAETVWVEPRRHDVKSKRSRDVVHDVPAFRMRVPSAAEFARMLKAA